MMRREIQENAKRFISSIHGRIHAWVKMPAGTMVEPPPHRPGHRERQIGVMRAAIQSI